MPLGFINREIDALLKRVEDGLNQRAKAILDPTPERIFVTAVTMAITFGATRGLVLLAKWVFFNA